jgi:hypothetical protein
MIETTSSSLTMSLLLRTIGVITIDDWIKNHLDRVVRGGFSPSEYNNY